MAKLHLLSNPPTDSGTYSSGLWSSSLPLTNLQTQQPKQVARSTSALTTSTKFIVALPRTVPISMFALIANNFTNEATVRLRVADNALGTAPSLDVTIPAFDPTVPFGSEPWGAFPWEGIEEDDQPGGAITFYNHPTTVYGNYVLVDIADAGNPVGYVQIGRFMAGAAFVPTYNMAKGAGLSFVDESKQSRSVGGQLHFDTKPKRRKFSCSFEALSEGEAYGAAYDLQRRLGITGNVLAVYDPDDPAAVVLRRTIYGTMPSLEDIVTANASPITPYAWRFSVEELV